MLLICGFIQLPIQKYLRDPKLALDSQGLLTKLKFSFGITSNRHKKYDNLVLFKYDQVESPMSEPLVQDCRGIILDNWEVVAMAFRKFFNFGESLAGKIDWSTASVLEKLDGSLCTLYAYDGSWQVSTTGQADAGGRVNKAGIITFADYFWETFHKSGMVLPPAHASFSSSRAP